MTNSTTNVRLENLPPEFQGGSAFPRLISRTCVTEWGGTLFAATRLGQLSFEATAVRIGDGGPDAAFATAAP